MAHSASFRRAHPPAGRLTAWTAPDGWRLRRFDWPRPAQARGRILFQAGRGDMVEKYLETLAHWHAQGWAITSFDWRGQGGSGRVAADTHAGHIDRFETYLEDLSGFWRDWSAEASGPRVAIGHSMGGHLILRAMLEGAVAPDAAVMVAPMLGLRSPVGQRIGTTVAGAMCRIGDPARRAWKANERSGAIAGRQALLTHDSARYADEGWWHATDPTLRLGPPSWRWLHEAFRSTGRMLRDKRLRRLNVPVLMLIAQADRLVDPRAALRIADRLPDVRTLRFGYESAHEILRESDAVRDRALAAIDAFLDERTASA